MTSINATETMNFQKEKSAPSKLWYVWACINNERAWILFNYSISWLLIAISLLLLYFNKNFQLPPYGTRNRTLFTPVLYTPLSQLSVPIANEGCENQTSIDVNEVFSVDDIMSPGTASVFGLLCILLLSMIFLLWYSWRDFSKKLSYRRLTPKIRSKFILIGFYFSALNISIVLIIHYGLNYYRTYTSNEFRDPLGGSCWLSLIDQLESQLFDNTITLDFRANVIAVRAVEIIGVSALLLHIICMIIYGSLACSVRTWSDAKTWNSYQYF